MQGAKRVGTGKVAFHRAPTDRSHPRSGFAPCGTTSRASPPPLPPLAVPPAKHSRIPDPVHPLPHSVEVALAPDWDDEELTTCVYDRQSDGPAYEEIEVDLDGTLRLSEPELDELRTRLHAEEDHRSARVHPSVSSLLIPDSTLRILEADDVAQECRSHPGAPPAATARGDRQRTLPRWMALAGALLAFACGFMAVRSAGNNHRPLRSHGNTVASGREQPAFPIAGGSQATDLTVAPDPAHGGFAQNDGTPTVAHADHTRASASVEASADLTPQIDSNRSHRAHARAPLSRQASLEVSQVVDGESEVDRDSDGRGSSAIGVLRINARPWAKVYVDGNFAGNTPQMHLELSRGRHRITLQNEELGLAKTFTVKIRRGEVETRIVDL